MMDLKAINAEYEQRTADVQRHLDVVLEKIETLEGAALLYREVNSLDEARAALAEDWRPMWPSVPTSEQWTARNGGDPEYLYLYWRFGKGPSNRNGRPASKTYIGNKPDRIELARECVLNREHWIWLSGRLADVKRRLSHCMVDLRSVDGAASRLWKDSREWVLEEVKSWSGREAQALGQAAARPPAPASPKEDAEE
jgi:hypothetical protein